MLLRSFAGLLVLASVGVVLLLSRGLTPRVQACSGAGMGSLEDFSRSADAILLVEPITLGGPNNAAPTVTRSLPLPFETVVRTATVQATATPTGVTFSTIPTTATPTPTPHPSATPYLGIAPPPVPAVLFDLTGYGGRFRVLQTIAGDVPSEIDVDLAVRADIEQQIRFREANWPFLTSCEIGFMNYNYKAGQRYVVVLDKDARGNWSTTGRFSLDGDRLKTIPNVDFEFFRATPQAYNKYIESLHTMQLGMKAGTQQRFFPGVGVWTAEFQPEPGATPIPPSDRFTYIGDDSVSLASFITAVRTLRADPTTSPPLETLPPDMRPPSIRPPDTGNGGLR